MTNEHPSILTELNAALTATPPSISQTPEVSSFTPRPISSMTGLLEMMMSSVACVFVCLLIVFSGSHIDLVIHISWISFILLAHT